MSLTCTKWSCRVQSLSSLLCGEEHGPKKLLSLEERYPPLNPHSRSMCWYGPRGECRISRRVWRCGCGIILGTTAAMIQGDVLVAWQISSHGNQRKELAYSQERKDASSYSSSNDVKRSATTAAVCYHPVRNPTLCEPNLRTASLSFTKKAPCRRVSHQGHSTSSSFCCSLRWLQTGGFKATIPKRKASIAPTTVSILEKSRA